MSIIRIASLSLVLLVGIVAVIGSGGDGGPVVPVASPGIYSGSLTPERSDAWVNTVGLMTTNSRLTFFDQTSAEFIVAGRVNNEFTGTLFSLTGIAPIQGQITSVSGTNIGGIFSSPLDVGTFEFVAKQDRYLRGADLSKLVGTWVDSVYVDGPGITTGITTWVIQPDGSFVMTSESGCAANGHFSLIDPTKNEYGVGLTVTDCDGFDGAYTGIGFLDDTDATSTNNVLTFTFFNGAQGGAFAPIRAFPLRSAFETLVEDGYSFSLSATGDGSVAADGDCTGTLDVTQGPASTTANFEEQEALSATEVEKFTFTICPLPSGDVKTINYYTTTFSPLGYEVIGDEYAVYTTGPVLPDTVKVGDRAAIGTLTLYADSTKAEKVGRIDVSFVVEPDTADTAIINLIYQQFDAASILEATEQQRWQITGDGSLTIVSVDVQQLSPPLRIVYR
jgi:hypothetical protein